MIGGQLPCLKSQCGVSEDLFLGGRRMCYKDVNSGFPINLTSEAFQTLSSQSCSRMFHLRHSKPLFTSSKEKALLFTPFEVHLWKPPQKRRKKTSCKEIVWNHFPEGNFRTWSYLQPSGFTGSSFWESNFLSSKWPQWGFSLILFLFTNNVHCCLWTKSSSWILSSMFSRWNWHSNHSRAKRTEHL